MRLSVKLCASDQLLRRHRARVNYSMGHCSRPMPLRNGGCLRLASKWYPSIAVVTTETSSAIFVVISAAWADLCSCNTMSIDDLIDNTALIRFAALALVIVLDLSVAVRAQDMLDIKIGYLRRAHHLQTISLVQTAPPDNGLAGSQMAVKDNDTTGRFLNQRYSLVDLHLKTGDDLANGRLLYVANENNNTVTVIDMDTIRPCWVAYSRAIRAKSVLLPAPLRPSRTVNVAGATANVTLSSAQGNRSLGDRGLGRQIGCKSRRAE